MRVRGTCNPPNESRRFAASCGRCVPKLGALGVHLAASFGGCVPLRSDTITRLGRIRFIAGSQAGSPSDCSDEQNR
jgi:hypothetical protein